MSLLPHRTPLAALVLAVGLLALGCAGPAESTSAADERTQRPPQATAEPTAEPAVVEPTPPELQLIATLAPVADLVAEVAGERARVRSLVPPGADSHTYEPRPSDVRHLTDADGYFGVGLGLNDAALRLAEANLPGDATVVLLAEETVDETELVLDHVHDDEEHSHDHDHPHGEDGHTHDDEESVGGPNPHVWLDVRLAMRFVEEIRDTLVELDGEGEDTYVANAADSLERLEALDAAIAEAVATVPEPDRKLVTYHDSWSYFGPRYGLQVVAAVQPADFSEPSASEVREIIDQIRAEDIPAVFGSEVFPSDVLQTIADETGTAYVADLSDDDLPGEPGDPEHSYVGLMRANARTIVTALGGDPSPLEGVGP